MPNQPTKVVARSANANEHVKKLNTIRINTTEDALKILPPLIELLKQVNMVLARNSRKEVFSRNAAIVEQKIKDGAMKPINNLPGVEVETKEEKPIEQPAETTPFEEEEVSKEAAKKAKKKLFGKKEK